MRLGSKDRARWCIYNCDCLFIELINGGLKLVTFFGQNKHSKRKKKLKHISYNDLKSRIWLQKYKRLWSLHLNRIQICSKSSFKRAKGSKQGRRKVWKSEGEAEVKGHLMEQPLPILQPKSEGDGSDQPTSPWSHLTVPTAL